MELNFLCSIQCFTEKSAATEDSAPGDKELVELDPLAGGGVHADVMSAEHSADFCSLHSIALQSA